MTEADRLRWDARYAEGGVAPLSSEQQPPPGFTGLGHLFPTAGTALELACGRGRAAVWLARRGMEVWAVDVSPVAIDLARELAQAAGVADRCTFDVFDLDDGLPPGDPVDMVVCHLFRDDRLDRAIMDRLVPGGVLALACLSEVGAGPGEFRVPPGGLLRAFGELDPIEHGEGEGRAWILARRPG